MQNKKSETHNSTGSVSSDGEFMVALVILVEKICGKEKSFQGVQEQEMHREKRRRKENEEETKEPLAFLPMSE